MYAVKVPYRVYALTINNTDPDFSKLFYEDREIAKIVQYKIYPESGYIRMIFIVNNLLNMNRVIDVVRLIKGIVINRYGRVMVDRGYEHESIQRIAKQISNIKDTIKSLETAVDDLSSEIKELIEQYDPE